MVKEAVETAAEALRVEELRVEESSTEARICGARLRLRGFQEKLLEEAYCARRGQGPRLVLLDAPTGAGKTLTLLAPLMAGSGGSLGVYPSRELAKDQMESVAALLERAGCRLVDGDPRSPHSAYRVEVETPYASRDTLLHLVRVTSDSLDELVEKLGYPSRRAALLGVAEAVSHGLLRGEPAVVFTVPEYPYLLLENAYRGFEEAGALAAALLEQLRLRGPRGLLEEDLLAQLAPRRELVESLRVYAALSGSAVFLDEAHAYTSGQEEAAAALAAAAISEHRRHGLVVVSSATHREEVTRALQAAAKALMTKAVGVSARPCHPHSSGCVRVRRETLILPLLVETGATGAPGYALAQYRVPDKAPRVLMEAEQLLGSICGSTWRRAMVFVDRVALVYRAAERLREAGYRGIACVTSLRRGIRHPACDAASPRDAKVIVGNEAISYGIDMPEVDMAVVYSRDPMQALQRIGRVGRGPHPASCPALVYLVLPGYAASSWRSGRISYEGLARLLGQLLPGLPALLEGLLRRHYALRAASFLAGYVAAKKKAAGMLGSSDEALRRTLEALTGTVEEKIADIMRLYTERYAVGGAALYRALSLRGGLTARICGDGAQEAGLLVAARNFRLEHSPEKGCLMAGAPSLYRYPALRLRTGMARDRLQALNGNVVSLRLLVDALGEDTALVQVGRSGEDVVEASLGRLLETGAVEPQQPVQVLAGIGSDVAEAAAALGVLLPVLHEEDGAVAALLPL